MNPGVPIQPAVLADLGAIAQRRQRAESEFASAVTDVEREEESARRAIEEGQRQLAALAALRREIHEKHAAVSEEVERAEVVAIRQGLEADRALLGERALLLAQATMEREAALQEQMKDPEVAEAIAEFERFVEVEATLGTLPASYRRAILEHHDKVRRRLDPLIAASNAGPPQLEVDARGVGLLLAADPPEGVPEALVVVLPVPYAVYRDWSERREDLASLLSYRAVSAVSKLLASVNAGDAPVQYTELHGSLAIQVWLGDCEIQGDLNERALEEIGAAREEAAELQSAGIELYGLWVRPALLAEEGS
jgi:hypothetical protein